MSMHGYGKCTSFRVIVNETSQCSKCIGSRYPAESQQIIVCRSQRQGLIGDNIELRCSASRVYRSLAVTYPGFFSGCCPDPPPRPSFFQASKGLDRTDLETPLRPVVDTPLLVFCCLSCHYQNLLSRVLSLKQLQFGHHGLVLSPKLSIYTVIRDLHN